MSDANDPLSRIADALERLAPERATAADWLSAPAYLWSGREARPIERIEAVPLALLKGIDRQKETVRENVGRLAAGHAAHDMLLWGARGMGKSALVRAAVVAAQERAPGHLALVQAGTDALQQRLRVVHVGHRDTGRHRHQHAPPAHTQSVIR